MSNVGFPFRVHAILVSFWSRTDCAHRGAGFPFSSVHIFFLLELHAGSQGEKRGYTKQKLHEKIIFLLFFLVVGDSKNNKIMST